MREGDRWFQAIVFLGRHNLQERDNLLLVESRHIQRDVVGRSTGHECRLNEVVIKPGCSTVVNKLTTDFDRSFKFQKNGLVDKDLTSASAEVLDLVFL